MGVKIKNVSRIEEIKTNIKELSKYEIQIGVFAGEAKTKNQIDYATIAGVHEHGFTIEQNYISKKTGKKVQRKIVIPERSFIRTTFDEKQDEWVNFIKRRLPKVITGEMSAKQLVELLGERITRDIKKKIKEIDSPPNAPSTIKAKGSSNPLIDTGGLRKRVTYKVVSR